MRKAATARIVIGQVSLGEPLGVVRRRAHQHLHSIMAAPSGSEPDHDGSEILLSIRYNIQTFDYGHVQLIRTV